MRNPKFVQIIPNYRKRALDVTLREGRKLRRYSLPFAVLRGVNPSARNPFLTITIEKELDGQGASFVLKDGSRGDFPADFVLYCCDPTYQWAPINQLKRALKDKAARAGLSVRVMADALRTSPSQVLRLMAENRASKQILQLLRLAELAGYRIEFTLSKKPAA